MKTLNLISVLLVFVFLATTNVFSQQKFFYARDKKITVTPSLTKVVVTKEAAYSDGTFNFWLENSGLDISFDLTTFIYDTKTYIITKKKGEISDLLTELKLNKDLYVVTPVYVTSEGAELAATDEILVQFKLKVPQEEIESLIHQFKLVTLRTISGIPNYYVLRIPPKGDPIEIANRLHESVLVEWSQPNFIPPLVKYDTEESIIKEEVNDPYFRYQFQLHNVGQEINYGRSGKEDADVDAPEAWKLSKGKGVIVAVIDEGVDLSHPDLSRLLAGYDFGDDDDDPSAAGDAAHGTACAGIVGARQSNFIGITGIAPECLIMPIKIWKDNGWPATVEAIAYAIRFAWENGAEVISNSWGFGIDSCDYDDFFPAITAAIGRAKRQGRNGLGSIVIFAIGNNANHVNEVDGCVAYPANLEDVIAVGASDRYDVQSNYSPTDDELDIVAPSHRAYQSQISKEGLEVWTTDITGDHGYNPTNETELPADDLDYTGLFGGTSAACPLVAGIAALILSKYPELPASHVERILMRSADKIGQANGSYDQNGFSRRYGYGRANAYRALAEAEY